MQQKAATPSSHITENQLIKSEYESSDNTPKEENSLQTAESKSCAINTTLKHQPVYGVVGIQRYVAKIIIIFTVMITIYIYETRISYLVATLFSSKKEVTAVAGITQNKPTSTVEGSKNGVSCTPINGPIISATIKAANGTNISCQAVGQAGGPKQTTQVLD